MTLHHLGNSVLCFWLCLTILTLTVNTTRASSARTAAINHLVSEFTYLSSLADRAHHHYDRSTVTTIFESSLTSLLSREVKDRYDVMYQQAAQQSPGARRVTRFAVERPEEDGVHGENEGGVVGGSKVNAPVPPSNENQGNLDGVAADGRNNLTTALQLLRSRSFISTEEGIVGLPMENLVAHARALQALHQSIPRTVQEWGTADESDQSFEEEAEPPTNMPSKDYLTHLFDITYLPTHVELYNVFPFLNPFTSPSIPTPSLDYLTGPFDPQHYLTPLNWLYFHSNMGHKRCEILNREYVEGLGAYVARRILQYTGPSSGVREGTEPGKREFVIAEVGAGNGALAYHLEVEVLRNLKSTGNEVDVKIVAVDAAGRLGDITESFAVEKMNHLDALRHYHPDMVIASWMSKGVDWTADFRDAESVREYILIGEIDYGVSYLIH
ncbi:hypothetical protein HK102_012349 [Quaeritorhiza haematococci]|nr:hypothetical protein HK102_012349 [Quaeritorhiza haematococci]